MKKPMIMLCAALAAFAAFAEGTNELSKAERLRMKTGGFVIDRRKASGEIVFVNAQQAVDVAALKEAAEMLERDCLVMMRVATKPSFAFETIAAVMKEEKARIAVFLAETDCPTTLTIAPEQGFAVVNVKALKKDSPDADTLTRRVRREMGRAMALTVGSGYAIMGGGMLSPAFSLEELDLLPSNALTVETSSAVQRLATERFGFKPLRRTFYVYALKEGWAPPPKGAYQKALWEQYHAKPTEPMRIEFNREKGE